MEFTTVQYDFNSAGKASKEIKKNLNRNRFDPGFIRRVVAASYELEMNQIVHSHGGKISCSILPDRVIITASDKGPGMEDVNRALTEGYSTAGEYARSLGWGAGMGLVNAKQVSDEFFIESVPGKGTVVRSVIMVNSLKGKLTHAGRSA